MQHSTAKHSEVQYSTAQYISIQYSSLYSPPETDGDPVWIALMTDAFPCGDILANTLMYSAADHKGELSPPLARGTERRLEK